MTTQKLQFQIFFITAFTGKDLLILVDGKNGSDFEFFNGLSLNNTKPKLFNTFLEAAEFLAENRQLDEDPCRRVSIHCDTIELEY